MSMRTRALLVCTLAAAFSHCPAQAEDLVLRPRPQIVQPAQGSFEVGIETRIVIPKGWPANVRSSANALALIIYGMCDIEPAVVEVDRPEIRKGDISIAPYDWLRPNMPWVEGGPAAINRPDPADGYNMRIIPEHVYVAGNSPRGCFLGLQTLIQIASQSTVGDEGVLAMPGLLIADWPDHAWRTLQLPLGVYGSTYDRGEHRYRHITKVGLLERSIRLAAHHKMSGLVVEVGCGMTYDRRPEIFAEGFATNEKADVRKAADLAKSLGIELVPFLNASGGHDIWLAPYPYAVPDSDLYLEALFDTIDECIETMRPASFHMGMDEDVAADFDGVPRRDVDTHRKVLLACYEHLRRRGVSTLVWNDGISLLGSDIGDIPRDIIVFPWMYGGNDFTPARTYIDQGFRILCSPWSQWHVENDQFFSLYASTLHSDKVLGMAGTIWYPVAPDGENDYRRCLVKAADAFWSPLQAGDYPNATEYYAPEYEGLPEQPPSSARPTPIAQNELGRLVALVTSESEDRLACEAAREKLVAAGTATVPALLDAMAQQADWVSPWAEGTLRRIARDPIGDLPPMVEALERAAAGGALRDLALELLGAVGDEAFLEKQDPMDPAVCRAMAAGGDRRFLPTLLEAASKDCRAQKDALLAIAKLRGTDELLALRDSCESFGDEAKETYARALATCASEEVIPALGDLSADRNWRVRFRAAIGLGATRSPQAGPHILKLLDDTSPAVFKTALYWCTDTLILRPEQYFPKLIRRLRVDEDEAFVKPIVHTLALMWDPGSGQWLAKNEDAGKRIDYGSLPVWKEKALIDALNGLVAYKDARLATDAIVVLQKMGAALKTEAIVSAVDGFDIEDKRWFCVRMRDQRLPDAAPVFKELWKTDDHLVRNFILQYCGMVITPETFEIAYMGYPQIPETDEPLRDLAVYTMAAHVQKLDDTARRAIPLILGLYEKTTWIDGRRALDNALCRAAGETFADPFPGDADEVAARIAKWKAWWEENGR